LLAEGGNGGGRGGGGSSSVRHGGVRVDVAACATW
jgi:hypothetical protein